MWNDTLHVTEEEIEDGQVEDPRCCAVALAVLRQIIPELPDADEYEAHVDGDGFVSIRLKGGYSDKYVVVRQNKGDYCPIYDFIQAFDDGNDVEPFDWKCKVKEAPSIDHSMRNAVKGEYKAKETK